MKIIFGLGNHEVKYNNTYHNVGFRVIDFLAKTYNCRLDRHCGTAKFGQCEINNEVVILVKPTTYMNLSGLAVKELLKKYQKATLADICIFSDDIDLPKGTYRYRERGSGGTHNGLRNIVDVLGSTDFPRIRIGIDKGEIPLIDYVLSKIDKESAEKIDSAIKEAVDFFVNNHIGH